MMTTRNHIHKRTASMRLGRGGLALVVAGIAVVGVGVGFASAQDSSPLSRALQQAHLDQMPPAKAELYKKGIEQAFPAAHANKPNQATAQSAPGVPDIEVKGDRSAGISDLRQAPFSSSTFAVEDSYQGMVKGRWYVVYAGTVGGEGPTAGQGGLRIMSADPGQNTNVADVGTFPAAGTSSLKVSAFSGTMLTLTTNTSTTLTFDLATLAYQ